MKEFQSPILVEIEDLAEGVYAASGASNPEPTPTPPPAVEDTPNWEVYWDHHNGGQKSYIRVKGGNHQKSGNAVTICLDLVSSASISGLIHDGDVKVDWDPKTIKFTRYGHFNSGDAIDFNVGAFSFEKSPGNLEETGAYYDTTNAPAHMQETMNNVTGPFIIRSVVYTYY